MRHFRLIERQENILPSKLLDNLLRQLPVHGLAVQIHHRSTHHPVQEQQRQNSQPEHRPGNHRSHLAPFGGTTPNHLEATSPEDQRDPAGEEDVQTDRDGTHALDKGGAAAEGSEAVGGGLKGGYRVGEGEGDDGGGEGSGEQERDGDGEGGGEEAEGEEERGGEEDEGEEEEGEGEEEAGEGGGEGGEGGEEADRAAEEAAADAMGDGGGGGEK